MAIARMKPGDLYTLTTTDRNLWFIQSMIGSCNMPTRALLHVRSRHVLIDLYRGRGIAN